MVLLTWMAITGQQPTCRVAPTRLWCGPKKITLFEWCDLWPTLVEAEVVKRVTPSSVAAMRVGDGKERTVFSKIELSQMLGNSLMCFYGLPRCESRTATVNCKSAKHCYLWDNWPQSNFITQRRISDLLLTTTHHNTTKLSGVGPLSSYSLTVITLQIM